VRSTDLSFHPLERSDFPLVARWLAEPHVAEWWDVPPELDAVEKEYGPCVDGSDPTLLFICQADGAPIGLVQIYRLTDNPEYADEVGLSDAGGVDLFIGEVAHLGVGFGTRIIGSAAELIWERYPEVGGAMAGPSVRNVRSRRAFEKAGFRALGEVTVTGEKDNEVILYLPRPTAG
jgi:aminoglycoside 6'-N-acetyltransferase